MVRVPFGQDLHEEEPCFTFFVCQFLGGHGEGSATEAIPICVRRLPCDGVVYISNVRGGFNAVAQFEKYITVLSLYLDTLDGGAG